MKFNELMGSHFKSNYLNEKAPKDLDAYVDELTNYGSNCYSRIEPDVLKVFAKHGIIFDRHTYGFTSEYTCRGALGLLMFTSISYQFRTGRDDFDKKAKLILNDIKYLLPKGKPFYWEGKTVNGAVRDGEVRMANKV